MHLGNDRVGSWGSSQSSLETVLWFFLGMEGREWDGMCEVRRLFWGYFKRIKLSGCAINTTQATENHALLHPGEETVWKSACGVLHFVGGSSSSAAFCSPQCCVFVKWLAPSHRVFPFSHLAAVAHKTLPVKGSAPEVAQVRPSGAGGWRAPGKDPSGLCRRRWRWLEPAGGGANSQALLGTAPLWEGRDCCSQLCLRERAALLHPPKTQHSLRTTAPDPDKHLLITFPSKCFKSKYLSI